MFDLGFSEIIVISVVALVVVGPERLPGVARTIGHLLGRAQRYVTDVKADIRREMQLEELQKLQADVQQQARALETSVRAGIGGVEKEVDATLAQVREALPDGAAATGKSGEGAVTETPATEAPAAALPAQESGGERS